MSADRFIWCDGELVRGDRPAVSGFDHGLLTGEGVFETLLAIDGDAFAWRQHDDRLRRSAEAFGIDVPVESVLRAALGAVIEANRLRRGQARLRLTITGGIAPLGSGQGESPPTTLAAAVPLAPAPATADVVMVPFTRNERGALTGVKATSYGENVLALRWARRRGGIEAIFANTHGMLCEGTGSNVFLVREGRLITPPLSSGCLAGVTRQLVLALCRDEGLEVFEDDVPAGALIEAEEAFLTSTTRFVQSIARVDATRLDHVPGPVTRRLAEQFAAMFDDPSLRTPLVSASM